MKCHHFCIWAFQIGQAPVYQSRDIKSSSPTMPKLSDYCKFILAIIDQCPNSSEQANGSILRLEGSSEVSKSGGEKSYCFLQFILQMNNPILLMAVPHGPSLANSFWSENESFGIYDFFVWEGNYNNSSLNSKRWWRRVELLRKTERVFERMKGKKREDRCHR